MAAFVPATVVAFRRTQWRATARVQGEMTRDPQDDLPSWICESIVDPWALESDPQSPPDAEGQDAEGRVYQHLPPQELLQRYPRSINICAPMVRYSKHAFRALVSQYNVQITTTPMILAQEFSRSPTARDSDFSTSPLERGFFAFRSKHAKRKDAELVRGALVCQMAANDSKQLADAAELIAPFVDGVDLNCGWSVTCLSCSLTLF